MKPRKRPTPHYSDDAPFCWIDEWWTWVFTPTGSVPWLEREGRELEDGMRLEVRLGPERWLPVYVRRRGEVVTFCYPLPHIDDELLIDIPHEAELRLVEPAA